MKNKITLITALCLLGLSTGSYSQTGIILGANISGMIFSDGFELDPCDFFVALDGDNDAMGTKANPFATLEQARTAVRDLKTSAGLPAGGVQICLRGGVYQRSDTFELTAQDSGEPGKPVIYRSAAGETARIVGAMDIPASGFSLVTSSSSIYSRIDPLARGKLMQIDLSQYTTDYGTLVSRGGGLARPATATRPAEVAALELFIDSQRMQLARWPDASEDFPFAMLRSTAATEQAPGHPRGHTGGHTFSYMTSTPTNEELAFWGDRPGRWSNAEDIWMHGYWRFYWSDKHVQVTDINTTLKTITFAEPGGIFYGLGATASWDSQERPYYVQNLLEEITIPGEWYLNRDSGILYLWPIEPLNSASEVMVSILEQPLVTLTDTSYVILRDLSFEMNRSYLLRIKGGEHSVAERSRFLNAGISAVVLKHGKNIGLQRCEVAYSGDAGVIISGGNGWEEPAPYNAVNRRNLISSGNSIRNTLIHDTGYWSWVTPAVVLEHTVGVRIANNNIYNTKYNAINFSGNNNIIEYNDIHATNQWSGDGGAIYTGRRWDWLGNVIRYNFIHDVQTGFVEPHGVHGIYLDDSAAGVRIFGNIINNVQHQAIKHRGGRDTIMQNNVLTNNGIALTADMAGINAGEASTFNHLLAMPYQGALWSAAYPKAALIPNTWEQIVGSDWRYPGGSVFQRNVGFGNDQFYSEGDYDGTGVFNKYEDISDNLENVESLYVNEAEGDFSLRPDSAAFEIEGFMDIPFKSIGIIPDP
ncbi:MAG: right-handed parallel beta-helix repeat-containing protein [Xanthomonadales bacterium]|nr:right-handed parallel beta-helix repeat-containing protein [Xanthomonadales bacterium]